MKIYKAVNDYGGFRVVEFEAEETSRFYKIDGWSPSWGAAFNYRTNIPKNMASLTPEDALERFIEEETKLVAELSKQLDQAKMALNRAGLLLHSIRKAAEAGEVGASE